MKRSGMPPRKSRLKQKKEAARNAQNPLRRMSTMPLTNVERQAKRKRQKARKYAAFRRSQGRKDALARAAGQCEMILLDGTRCPATEEITVHHKTYARFGGKELPTDLAVLCQAHHTRVEMTKHGYRHTNRRSA